MARPEGTKNIETPEDLLTHFKEYVKYEQEHPMRKVEYVGKDGRLEKTPLETPVTFDGFECYLRENNVIKSHLGHYEDKNYLPIITHIRQFCYVHNFKGAAVNLFNANLIAKKLGLTEKIETTNIEQPLFNDVPKNNSDK